MRRFLLPFVLMLLSACGGGDSGVAVAPTTTAPYSQVDLVVGTGAVAAAGSQVSVAYTGWLHDSTKPDAKGAQFDSATNFPFVVGAGNIIRGWNTGVLGMRVGGQRRLVIPPDLAYGNSSPGPGIPANATLVFDITLNAVQ